MSKQSTWSETHQYQVDAIKSVPTTEKYGKSLTKVKETLKTTNIKEQSLNIEKKDLHFTISQGAKTPSPRYGRTRTRTRKH